MKLRKWMWKKDPISIQFAPRMPDPAEDPVDAVKWMVQNLMKDLQEAKMWPIKMASMKHQEKLRNLAKLWY